MSPDVLVELLEQRRVALEALPGVIGTAVGAGAGAGDAGGDERAIHLYVTPRADAGRVSSEAKRLLDGAPVELIEMELPEAQPD